MSNFIPFTPNPLPAMAYQHLDSVNYMFDKTSFSLEELVGKCLQRLNDNIISINNMENAILEFENYVIQELVDYDAKVQAEVNSAINNLITNGTIASLINTTIFGQLNTDLTNLTVTVSNLDSKITKLNYKLPSISITSLPQQLLYNVGESINTILINFHVTKGTNNLVKAELYKNDVLIQTLNNVNNGDNQFIDGNIITSDSNYYVIVYDDTSFIKSDSIQYNFVNNYFYGIAGTYSSIDSNFVKSLTSLKTLKSNLTENFACNNQKIIFAYPSSYGNLLEILVDSMDFLEAFQLSQLTINSTTYNIYVSNNYLTDAFNISFNIQEDSETINYQPSENLDGGVF